MDFVAGRTHAGLVADAVRGSRSSTTAINNQIVESWRRCLQDYALDPERRPDPVVVARAELHERQERVCDLVNIARSEMTNLYQQVAGSGYAILLSDSDGVVLNYVGDPMFTGTASRTALQTGAVWSEKTQGTNGMGTCLVEKRPLVIHQDEHFFTKNTKLTCSAAPIFDPTGELVAVLDASSDSSRAQHHTMVLVNMSAQLIENRLFLCCMNHNYILRFHSRPEFISTLGEGALAIDQEGNVQAANRSALFQLDVADVKQIIGKPVEQLFAIRHSQLQEKAHHDAGTHRPLHDTRQGRRFFASFQPPHAANDEMQGQRSTARSFASARPQRSPQLDGLEFGDVRMRRNVERATKLLDRDIPFILLGETGTGKDVFANAIHKHSTRAEKPFVAVNCASLPETLIESELFGYRPGAFTGASRDGSRGKILQAHGGTLFLDEIGDMPLQLQARLLRVLEEREVIPLGGEVAIKVDIRLISATHKDLMRKVEEGSFREDLYYRLNGISLHMPPLREREDRRALITHLARQEAGTPEGVTIEDAAMDALDWYEWPGNIRQLRNTLRTLIGLCDNGLIRRDDLPDEILSGCNNAASRPTARPHNPLDIAERDTLLRELETAHWNVTRVASKLKLSRNTLYRKMRRLDIRSPR
ncbi:MAG: sigma-54-dependent Fis family transcriptional regulator [Gammaproteobacteria bacterium]|nr:sigma-54-dependent Fis family transcriptional regulator [Gammaproteobacteria bacterium]